MVARASIKGSESLKNCRRRPGVEPVRRPELSQLPAGILADSGRGQVRDRESEAVTEISGGGVNAQIVDGGPQVELCSRRVATEAAEAMAAEWTEKTLLCGWSSPWIGQGPRRREPWRAVGMKPSRSSTCWMVISRRTCLRLISGMSYGEDRFCIGPNREEAQVFMASVGEAAWPLCHPCWARAA